MKLASQPISATSNSFKTCRRSRTTRSGGTLGEMSPGIVSAEAPDIAFRVQRLIAASGIAVIVMRLADHHGAFVPGMEAMGVGIGHDHIDAGGDAAQFAGRGDRKSTRLNSSP